MFEFLNITKALAEENRLRILLALDGAELCVCQLVELLELAPSTVSKHMSVLRQARLVESRKDGRWMHYRLADDGSHCLGKSITCGQRPHPGGCEAIEKHTDNRSRCPVQPAGTLRGLCDR